MCVCGELFVLLLLLSLLGCITVLHT